LEEIFIECTAWDESAVTGQEKGEDQC
jgi:hypothetical protein